MVAKIFNFTISKKFGMLVPNLLVDVGAVEVGQVSLARFKNFVEVLAGRVELVFPVYFFLWFFVH